MLRIQPKMRCSALEAFSHPFLSEALYETEFKSEKFTDTLYDMYFLSFSNSKPISFLKRGILKYIAVQVIERALYN